MTRKRDGPASQDTTPSPGQKGDDRPHLLPSAQTPRKTSSGHPSTSHRQVRHREPQGWRQFRVRIITKPDSEGATALYAYLRAAAKRYGLEVASVDEIHDDKSTVKKRTEPSA